MTNYTFKATNPPLIFLIVGLGLILITAACGSDTPAESADLADGTPALLQQARRAGLRVGFVQEIPYGYLDDQGNLTGFDIEVTREAARRVGIQKIIGVHLGWEGLIPGLLAGRIDIIPIGMAIRPERCEVVNFSDPIYTGTIGAMVRAGNPKNIHGYQDFLERDDIKMGGTVGAAELTIARKDFGIPKERIIGYSEQVQVIDDLRAGRIDAAIYTTIFVERYLADEGEGELERAVPFEVPGVSGNAGHAFRKKDARFLELWNEGIRGMKEDGTLEAIAKRWNWPLDDLVEPQGRSDGCCAGDHNLRGCETTSTSTATSTDQ